MKSLLPILLLILSLLAAPAHAAELNVFAAASLTDALEEIGAAYQKAGGDTIRLNLGASSLLARQIEEGAPADLFLSADEEKMDALGKRGLLLPGTRRSVLSNTLVIVVPAGSAVKIAGPKDLAAVSTLALADPEAVPAGLYAKEYLRKLGLWEKLAGKVVPMENVRGALAAVESGNVDAAIVYKTDARISKRVRIAYGVPLAQGPKISYPFAVVAESKRKEAAKRFLAYLEAEPALAVFRKHGFLIKQ